MFGMQRLINSRKFYSKVLTRQSYNSKNPLMEILMQIQSCFKIWKARTILSTRMATSCSWRRSILLWLKQPREIWNQTWTLLYTLRLKSRVMQFRPLTTRNQYHHQLFTRRIKSLLPVTWRTSLMKVVSKEIKMVVELGWRVKERGNLMVSCNLSAKHLEQRRTHRFRWPLELKGWNSQVT